MVCSVKNLCYTLLDSFFVIEYSNQKLEVHLHAVKIALEELSIPLDKDDLERIPSAILEIQRCQNSINSILAMHCTNLATEIRFPIVFEYNPHSIS